MFKLWKCSTIVFVFQVLVGGITYWLSGELRIALAAAAAFAFVVFVVAAFAAPFTPALAPAIAFAAVVAVVAAVVAAAFAALDLVFAAIVSVFVAAIVSVFFAATEEKRVIGRPEEPFLCLWLAALPAGVGTVFGGLVYFFCYRQRQFTLT